MLFGKAPNRQEFLFSVSLVPLCESLPGGGHNPSPRDGRDGFAAGQSAGLQNPALLVSVSSASLNAIRGQISGLRGPVPSPELQPRIA